MSVPHYSTPNPPATVEAFIARDFLEYHLKSCPPFYVKVFLDVWMQGYTIQEIAARYCVKVWAIKQCLQHMEKLLVGKILEP